MELFLSNNRDSYFLKLLSSYTRLDKAIIAIELSANALKLVATGVLNLGQLPVLVTEDATLLRNTFTIAQYMTELSCTEDILLGETALERAEVVSVFELAQELSIEDLLNHYTKVLEPRVFVTSRHVTLGDIYLFLTLYNRVTELTEADKAGPYVHLFRWFNLVQHLPGIKEFNLSNRFVLVEPPSPFAKVETQKKKKK